MTKKEKGKYNIDWEKFYDWLKDRSDGGIHQKKIPPPQKKVFFQFNKITFSSLRLQDLGSNFSKFSRGGGHAPKSS
jgi:hypothetical protein